MQHIDFSQAKRGPVLPPQPSTVELLIRLDEDLLDWLRMRMTGQGGGDYRQVINQAVREYKARIETQTGKQSFSSFSCVPMCILIGLYLALTMNWACAIKLISFRRNSTRRYVLADISSVGIDNEQPLAW